MPRQPTAALDAARREVGLAQADLWLRYFELGGMAMPREVEFYLLGPFGTELPRSRGTNPFKPPTGHPGRARPDESRPLIPA